MARLMEHSSEQRGGACPTHKLSREINDVETMRLKAATCIYYLHVGYTWKLVGKTKEDGGIVFRQCSAQISTQNNLQGTHYKLIIGPTKYSNV